jgi:DNA-directed RNA polymerase specialized sigma24 family protein
VSTPSSGPDDPVARALSAWREGGAGEDLARLLQRLALASLRRRGVPRQDAEDCAQETALKLLVRFREGYVLQRSGVALVAKAAWNVWQSRLRSARPPRVLELPIPDEPEEGERSRLVREALPDLDEADRVLLLRVYLGQEPVRLQQLADEESEARVRTGHPDTPAMRKGVRAALDKRLQRARSRLRTAVAERMRGLEAAEVEALRAALRGQAPGRGEVVRAVEHWLAERWRSGALPESEYSSVHARLWGLQTGEDEPLRRARVRLEAWLEEPWRGSWRR